MAQEPTEIRAQPPWNPPTDGVDVGLKVRNSLALPVGERDKKVLEYF